MEALLVLPMRHRVCLEGSIRVGLSRSWVSMASSTARPPVWMQKWFTALAKLGV